MICLSKVTQVGVGKVSIWIQVIWLFAHKSLYSQSYGFTSNHVWMWELVHKEGWALNNWYFQTVVQRRLLIVLWRTRRSNQSILKEKNPEYSLEGLMLKLKLQYFGHLIWRADSLEKILMLGKTEGRRRGQREMRRLRGITNLGTWVWANARKQWRSGKPAVLQFMGSQRVGHDLTTEQKQSGSKLNPFSYYTIQL